MPLFRKNYAERILFFRNAGRFPAPSRSPFFAAAGAPSGIVPSVPARPLPAARFPQKENSGSLFRWLPEFVRPAGFEPVTFRVGV